MASLRRTFAPLVLGLAALTLAACASKDTLLPPLAEVEVPAVEYRKPPEPQAPPAPQPQPTPATLVGQTEPGIRDYLGTPDLVRREDPAEIWRYGDATCGVHLFFYQKDGQMRVEHVDTSIADTEALTPAACLSQLRQRNAKPAASLPPELPQRSAN